MDRPHSPTKPREFPTVFSLSAASISFGVGTIFSKIACSVLEAMMGLGVCSFVLAGNRAAAPAGGVGHVQQGICRRSDIG